MIEGTRKLSGSQIGVLKGAIENGGRVVMYYTQPSTLNILMEGGYLRKGTVKNWREAFKELERANEIYKLLKRECYYITSKGEEACSNV